jgi:glycosyltransferase involved in cell wall biosynthesis
MAVPQMAFSDGLSPFYIARTVERPRNLGLSRFCIEMVPVALSPAASGYYHGRPQYTGRSGRCTEYRSAMKGSPAPSVKSRDRNNSETSIHSIHSQHPSSYATPAQNLSDGSRKGSFAFVLPWPLKDDGGGVNQVILNLAAECKAGGHFEPLVLECNWEAPVSGRRFDFPVEPIKDISIANAIVPLWRGIILYLLHLPRLLYRLHQIANKYRVVAFNAQFVGVQCLNLVLAKKLGLFRAAVVLTFQGDDVRNAINTFGIQKMLVRWTLRHADIIVACSRDLMGEVRLLEHRLQKPLVIHNAIHEGHLAGQASTPAVIRDPDSELIVTVGRFEHRKGHDLIVQAFAHLAQHRSRATLWIIGKDGPTYQHTADLVQSLGLSAKVRLFRDVPHEQIASTISQADVFVFASRWVRGVTGEGLPLAILEAGLLGLPVVSTRTTGVDDILSDGENSRVVQLESVPQLARAVADMLENPVQARQFGSRLRELVRTKYSVQRAWQAYCSLISG